MDAEAAHTNSFSELLARELDKVIEIEVKPGCRGESPSPSFENRSKL